ncbi:protein of unknown function [Methylococcus capsulatus]|uniref:Uncharacterized protein n=1 Tax=Methylococcus capsulatus TaxID=414 RepID=A0AA35UN62_METCP|nr:protein of unknown function [Methylococcus capsulatus]
MRHSLEWERMLASSCILLNSSLIKKQQNLTQAREPVEFYPFYKELAPVADSRPSNRRLP